MRDGVEIGNLPPRESKKEGLKEKLAEICWRNNIVFMVVFGSLAKGKQRRKSDVDVAIEFEKDSGKFS